MTDCGNLLLALIDNLSEVQFTYPTELGTGMTLKTDAEMNTTANGECLTVCWDLKASEANLRGNDVKKYGESREILAALLAMLEDGEQRVDIATRLRLEESFSGMTFAIEDTVDTQEEAWVSYVLQASVSEEESFMLPGLALNEKEHTFSFSYDLLSSYLSVGTYVVEKGILTAITDDGLYYYQFKVLDEDTLEFMQEGSSEVRLINEEMGIAVQDGAEFKRKPQNAGAVMN